MSTEVMECAGEIESGSGQLPPGHPTIRFPGQYFDEETGLHYNRFRYYDPEVGRYVSADPISQLGGVNVYVYSFNDPVNRLDPFGLFNIAEGLFNRFTGGGNVNVPFSDVDPGVSPSDFPGFNALAANTPPGGTTQVNLSIGVDVGDVGPGLGRVKSQPEWHYHPTCSMRGKCDSHWRREC